MRRFLVLPLLGALVAAEPMPDPEVVHAEQLLKSAGLSTDGPALVAFFKTRTLSTGDQERLTAAVKRLGDDNFDVREKASSELTAAGRLALAYLRPALRADDPEVVVRARRCIEDIERVPTVALVGAVALLAGEKRPDGATEAMLNSLPWIDDDSARERIFLSLARTGIKDGVAHPALKTALADKEAVRRAAAAAVYSQGTEEQRRTVAPLLRDTDATVRYHTASGLVRSGDKSAVLPLMALLTDSPLPIAWQTEDLLYRVGGDKVTMTAVGSGNAAERTKARDAWEAWWKANGEKIDLAKIKFEEAYQGLTIIAELENRVWECSSDGTKRWEVSRDVSRPIDARALPGRRMLVAEHGANRVTERDQDGKILWEMRVQSQPVSCQRLPSGNTFIATYQEILEVTPAKTTVYSYKKQGMIYHAEKYRDGSIVYVTSGNQVVELDATGREVRTLTTPGQTSGWASVERLPSGNYLVALYSSNLVVEMDATGKKVWECKAQNPGHATRLRNGNTLVASIEGRKVIEYDRDGNEKWSQPAPGRPFHAWRR